MAARPINIPAGAPLYRSFDKRQADMLEGDTARRTIAARMTLRRAASGIALDIAIDGITASAALPIEPQPAKTPQLQRRRETLTKTGDTVYRITEVDDRLGDEFVAASQLTALRRKTIEALDRSMATHAFRRLVRKKSDEPISGPLPESASVANHVAAEFYRRRGATEPLPLALETEPERMPQDAVRETAAAKAVSQDERPRYSFRTEIRLPAMPHGTLHHITRHSAPPANRRGAEHVVAKRGGEDYFLPRWSETVR